jgi:hypothetical protein
MGSSPNVRPTRKTRTAAVLFCVVISSCFVSPAATTFDLNADFSVEQNPNQVWEYGYSETNSLDPAQFRVNTYVAKAGPLVFWHPAVADRPGPGYYPYVAYNPSAQSQYGSSNGWSARPGEVAMEASDSGQYSLVRFTAPRAGVYAISARFEGVHFGLSSTDVHVLHNAKSLFDAFIEGYGGDPAFHKVEGASPATSYSGQIEMVARDTVTFACGYGSNKTHFSDTTGLFARLVLLSNTPARR